ncbi:MAG TPA: glycoside hydrolase family 125 protein [Candidatus Baltobacteraceae bacterium]|nr:glycoside hydrolase family 125 protein [Candidatus Baltobacteraceae bacterium]
MFHTLFSDFYSEPDHTTYVQTGDIPAMWLRDSSAQTIPYVRFARAYPVLALRFSGVIERNAKNIVVDPYANAFRADYSVWERKWEADSLAWPVLLTWVYSESTRSRLIFTPALHQALWRAVDTWRCEQLHATCSHYPDSQPYQGHAYNTGTGMIWTAYRPSDDPVRYHFNIPQEAIAAVALFDIAQLAAVGYHDRNLANEAHSIASQVQIGIERYGRVWNPAYGGWVYVYETDGLGHNLYIDDANIPNLTSLPYIGYCSPYDPVYLNTRAYTLAKGNPFYFKGAYAEGLGSAHTPRGFVWPLGIIARALTATSETEVTQAITTLAETDSSDGLIHESFWPNGYWLFTRADFGWANASYAELLFRSIAGFPGQAMTPFGQTLKPFEPLARMPRLTDTLTQLRDTITIYRALGDLLEKADYHTIIPAVHNVLQRSAGPGDLHWHEMQDEP